MSSVAVDPELDDELSELSRELAEPAPRADWRDRVQRLVYLLLALALAAGTFYFCYCYLVPVHQGVDQNGYLVGGKQLAATGTMKFSPHYPGSGIVDPHQFVGRMWVGADLGTENERYYPKYPIGFPAIIAAVLKTAGEHAVFWINPIATTLAVFGSYLLARALLKPWPALIAAALFATSPSVIFYSTNPNSHATAVCFVVWGFYFLFRWWQAGGYTRAIFAGLFIGYSATIRYTEGMLVLPLLIAMVYAIRSHGWKESLVLLSSWLLPLAVLVTYNKSAMGTWTGYDDTNESTGFSVEYFLDNWETTLRHMGTTAVLYFFPLTLAGLVWMFHRAFRPALLLASWIVPSLLLYTSYYWAPDWSVTGYTRFFVTIIPACTIAAMWLVQQVIDASPGRGIVPRLAAGLVAMLALAANVKTNVDLLDNDQFIRLNVWTNLQLVEHSVPEGSVVFCPDENFLQPLQFSTDHILYAGHTFNAGWIANLPNIAPADEPQGLQPGRRDALHARLSSYPQKDLDDLCQQLMLDAIDAGKRVFFVVSMRQNDRWLTLAEPEREKRFPAPVQKFSRSPVLKVEISNGWPQYLQLADVKPNKPRGRRVEQRPNRDPTWWQIFELVKRPPALKK